MAKVPGVVDLSVEPQTLIPQIPIVIDRRAAARYGLTPGDIAEQLEAALNGETVSRSARRAEHLRDRRSRRLGDALDRSKGCAAFLRTEAGAQVPVSEVAHIEPGQGPNQILHENGQRRIVVQANVADRSHRRCRR